MPVTGDFRENGRISFTTITDPWETRDLTNRYVIEEAHRSSVPYTVHSIMDFTEMRTVPMGIFRARLDAPALVDPNAGMLVLVGTKPLARSVAEMIFRLAHFDRAYFVDTVEEAMALVRERMAEEDRAAMPA